MTRRFIASIIGAGLFITSCSDVGRVDELTIGNDTAFPARVEVSDADRNGWLRLAVVSQGSSKTVEEVADQGDVWVFRFDYIGRHSETVEVSRADLESADWQVAVPDSFEQGLEELGVEPPP